MVPPRSLPLAVDSAVGKPADIPFGMIYVTNSATISVVIGKDCFFV